MAEEPPPRIDLDQVAEIVSSYVRHHQIAADQLAGLIVEVHRALAGLARATPAQEPPEPAVPIRRSVQQDYIVCLECGYRAQMLRHLRIAHGLEVADYRTRRQLPLDFPLIAPSYSRGARRLPRRSGSGVTPPRNRARRPRAARGLAEPRSGSRPPPSAPSTSWMVAPATKLAGSDFSRRAGENRIRGPLDRPAGYLPADPGACVDAAPTCRGGQTGPVGSGSFRSQLRSMGLPPDLAQQDPCHSASDDGPNGGRACPRHQVTQHLSRDNHNECDYGSEQNETRDNRGRCPISNIVHCALPHAILCHLADASADDCLIGASPTTWPTASLKPETRFDQDRFHLWAVGAVPRQLRCEFQAATRGGGHAPGRPQARRPPSPPSNGA
jgi:predicted transcriptional regulator